MTRVSRATRFPCAISTSFIGCSAIALLLAAGNAFADDVQAASVSAQAAGGSVAADTVPGGAAGPSASGDPANDAAGGAAEDTIAALPVAGGMAEIPSTAANANAALAGIQLLPSIERPLHHFYCVEYARLRSGLQIFGDAKTWWTRAENAYARLTQPVGDAVMVFAGSRRIHRGHVAVVAAVVSAREIRVDQANWQNHGEIDRATPVLDVSPNNDWSEVRVWDMASGQFGVRVYAIKGFIARPLAVQEKT